MKKVWDAKGKIVLVLIIVVIFLWIVLNVDRLPDKEITTSFEASSAASASVPSKIPNRTAVLILGIAAIAFICFMVFGMSSKGDRYK